ncbi:DotU family type IV/VI secretion system protein [Zavarzinella formosa]|uniref:DotU family type IV/VI secretion system protein n=1 Tax=Zavarzinella formosa TaxID=360055 RepID=UPI00031503B3|nr:DotU family type IV/VI secretion system protein [Zavarzinella formosa]
MNDLLARQVYPVLLHGLKLRARLDRHERPNLVAEQAELKRLLGTSSQPSPWGTGKDVMASVAAHEPPRFQGLRYPLVCWLDEMFIESPWSREWDENKLESALFETNIRYRNFWEQAKMAESLPESADVLEGFLMCVLLGFRGELAERPEAFREWVGAARSRCSKGYGKELPAVPERPPTSDVPMLLAVEGYRKMTKIVWAGVLISIPVVTALLVTLLR